MKPIRPALCLLAVALLLGGCLVDIQEPTRAPRPTASPSRFPTPTAVPTLRPSPTPGLRAVPQFTAGDRVTASAPGLRVRSRPGVDQRVLTSLGIGAELLVALGPVWVDDTGWYLVADANRADLGFKTGWVAAGTEADPFLAAATFSSVSRNPYLGGFAGEADGDFGPMTLPDGHVSVLWLAAPPTPTGCSFLVDFVIEGQPPVRAITASIGGVPGPGELFSNFFATHHGLVGKPLSVSVASDCSWALSFVRDRPQPTPSP
jgi:hypothetical protein